MLTSSIANDGHCPHCGTACRRDTLNAILHGPWGCPHCGWSSNPKYDCREGVRWDPDNATRVLDQYGRSHPVEGCSGKAVLAGMNVHTRGALEKSS